MLYARSIPTRYFTPQEANEVVPAIRAYLLKIREDGQALVALERARLEAESEQEVARIGEVMTRRVLGQAHLLDRIHALGAELMDPLELGRVRFPAMRNGEPVWLIWNLGEPKIERWSPIGAPLFGSRAASESTRVGWEWRN